MFSDGRGRVGSGQHFSDLVLLLLRFGAPGRLRLTVSLAEEVHVIVDVLGWLAGLVHVVEVTVEQTVSEELVGGLGRVLSETETGLFL